MVLAPFIDAPSDEAERAPPLIKRLLSSGPMPHLLRKSLDFLPKNLPNFLVRIVAHRQNGLFYILPALQNEKSLPDASKNHKL
jgi:hypothetical protein